MTIRTIGISLKSDQPQLGGLVHELEKWLRDRSIEVLLGPHAAEASGLPPGFGGIERFRREEIQRIFGGHAGMLATWDSSRASRRECP